MIWNSSLAIVVIVVGAGVALAVGGQRSVLSLLAGSAMTFAYLLITAGTFLLGSRASGGDLLNPRFLLIVFGGWTVKFGASFVLLDVLSGQAWIDKIALLIAVVVSVVGSLTIDVVLVIQAQRTMPAPQMSKKRSGG